MKTPEREHQAKVADEIWFREVVREDLENHRINRTIRLGDRRFGTTNIKGGYRTGDNSVVKVLKADGSFEENVKKIKISAVITKKFSELKESDFLGTAETPEELVKYYGEIEPDQEVSIIDFDYQ